MQPFSRVAPHQSYPVQNHSQTQSASRERTDFYPKMPHQAYAPSPNNSGSFFQAPHQNYSVKSRSYTQNSSYQPLPNRAIPESRQTTSTPPSYARAPTKASIFPNSFYTPLPTAPAQESTFNFKTVPTAIDRHNLNRTTSSSNRVGLSKIAQIVCFFACLAGISCIALGITVAPPLLILGCMLFIPPWICFAYKVYVTLAF